MSFTLKPLDQQVILITGASSGIGLVTARAAARQGAAVVLVARNERALEAAVAGIEQDGGRATYAVADVGDPDQLEAAADKAISRFGRIDTWVNNAGVTIYAKLMETPLVEHQQMVRTNYFGAVNGAILAVENLRERGGALIQVGSIASDLPTPLMGAYAATKHAVKGYINSLRAELRAEGAPISVTLIKPSGIDTPIGQHAAAHIPGEAELPPPVYDPQLVADAILSAAVHPRREVTVGGVGRAQVLIGTHFPQLLDALSKAMMPLLIDRTARQTPGNSLFASAEAGRERSGVQPHALRHSAYTAVQLNRGKTALALGLIAGAAGLWLARRRRSRP